MLHLSDATAAWASSDRTTPKDRILADGTHILSLTVMFDGPNDRHSMSKR